MMPFLYQLEPFEKTFSLSIVRTDDMNCQWNFGKT